MLAARRHLAVLLACCLFSGLPVGGTSAQAKPRRKASKRSKGSKQKGKVASGPLSPREELRRFEERTFPRARPGQVVRRPELTVPARRGRARPTAINPPSALRSHGRGAGDRKRHDARADSKTPTAATGGAAAAAPRTKPAHGLSRAFLSRLKMPDLPVIWSSKLLSYLAFYKTNPHGRRLMRHWLTRAGRYEQLIRDGLRKHNAPRSLVHVAMIESSFNPRRTSRVGAAGLWQFMPRSGRWFGLARDYWIDERRNPTRSTDAAARLLKYLHSKFGTWELALAAYNAGAGAIRVAMKRFNTNDYYQLCRYEAGLPWPTTLYVPKVLATAIVALNRQAFGFGTLVADKPLTHALVRVTRSVTVRQLARAAGIDVATIRLYNPELRRHRTPPGKSWVRVPKGAKDKTYAALGKLGRAKLRPYRVRLGETDAMIATRLGIGRRRLRAINGLRYARELRPGMTILVPTRTRATRRKRPRKTRRRRPSARRGGSDDTRVLVALPPGAPRQVAGRQRVFYRTISGDELGVIAEHLGVSRAEMAAWNGLDPRAKLVSNMVLQAFVKPRFDRSRAVLLPPDELQIVVAGSVEHVQARLERDGRRRVVYRARRRDTLRRLSSRFGLSVGSLMRINRFARHTRLKKGQRVILYVYKSWRDRRRQIRKLARRRWRLARLQRRYRRWRRRRRVPDRSRRWRARRSRKRAAAAAKRGER